MLFGKVRVAKDNGLLVDVPRRNFLCSLDVGGNKVEARGFQIAAVLLSLADPYLLYPWQGAIREGSEPNGRRLSADQGTP